MTHWLATVRRFAWKRLGVATAVATLGILTTQIHQARITIESASGVQHKRFWTWDQSWAQALRQLHLSVGRHDRTNIRLTVPVTSPLRIHRGIQVAVNTFHHHYHVWTTRYHVQDVLAALHIHLGPLDKVAPGLKSSMSNGTVVDVWRRWYVTKTVDTTVGYATSYRPDPSLYAGNRVLVQQGQNGRRQQVIKILMQNGQPVKQAVSQNQVVMPPVDEIIAYGTLGTIARGGQVVNFSREINMVATGYWPDPSWSSGFTASGMKAGYGVVAVDPAVIPLGARLYVSGYGFAVAGDTGSAIVGNRIDLGFNSQSAAMAWGVRSVQVFVVK